MGDIGVAQGQAGPQRLKRSLGSGGVLLLTFSALSPALSVYVGGPSLMQMAGTGAALAFIVGGIIAAVLALLYAELGAAFPRAGGTYPTIAGALGSGAGFPILIVAALSAPAITGFFALGFGEYLHFLIPGVSQLAAAIACILAACAIACLKIRTGALVTGAFLAVELTALALLTFVAATHPARGLGELLTHPVMVVGGAISATPALTLLLGVVSGVWTTSGAQWAMNFGEDMDDAERKMGPVIAWTGLLSSLIIAGPVVLVLMSAPDLPGMLKAEAPYAFFLSHTASPWVASLVAWGVALAVFNAVIATVLASGRLLYATARDGVWPKAVNRVVGALHPGLNTPVIATVVLGVTSVAATFLGQRFLQVMLAGDVFTMFLVSAGVFVGRRAGRTGTHFRAPVWPLSPFIGAAAAVVFAWSTFQDTQAGRPGMIILGVAFFGALAWDYWRRRSGAEWRMGAIEEG